MTDRKDFDGEQDFESHELASNTTDSDHMPALTPVPGQGSKTGVEKASNGAGSGEIDISKLGQKVRAALRATLGDEVYSSWFNALEFVSFDGELLKVTVPVKFLRNWIQTHYTDALLRAAAVEFKGVSKVDVQVRQPGGNAVRPAIAAQPRVNLDDAGRGLDARKALGVRTGQGSGGSSRGPSDGFGGSPLDPRCTFESFVVGAANRMAHAGATQVAETIFAESRGFNPLYIHAGVGHGKTHLLQAIAWEVKRRTPHANVLYLTAERFRFQFVEAIKSQDAMAFKDQFRSVDVLLIDDLEFMQGEKTELEFEHIINTMLDGGRQLVVASARAPGQLVRLNDRMRSRLQRGLITEIQAFDYELRIKVLERRIQEKRAVDPSFEIPREVIELLAERLTDGGREFEGAVTRLYATWQYMRTPITVDLVETIVRDLISGVEPRRIKIEDILRIISRHFGVSRADILSQRRHRSVVWPRQIGMYLAKQMTSRSLPEIGRRFGGRDHTTVLHAIRKIDGEINGNGRLKDEIEELKKQLAS
ncbi:MAG: chromosomal replication initiator protein DnaA [Hyphomicrobiaceae bacterium]